MKLKIYDLLGRDIAMLVNESQNAGIYEVQFSAESLSSGIYFYRLKAGDFNEIRKMVVVK